jgi:hypothetical protein
MLDIECSMPDVNCAVEFRGHRYCLRAYANNIGDSDEEEDGGDDSDEDESEGVRMSKIAKDTRMREEGEHENEGGIRDRTQERDITSSRL